MTLSVPTLSASVTAALVVDATVMSTGVQAGPMSESETLETMRPNPAFAPSAYEDTMATWERVADDVVVTVWGGDWCVDCRQQLPDFAAVMDAAGVDAVEHNPVELVDGEKVGPGIVEYDVDRIPTVVVEDAESGAELARFVESASRPIAVALADDLADSLTGDSPA